MLLMISNRTVVSLPQKRATKAYGGVEATFNAFWNSKLDGGKQASRFTPFILG
jgi:hypothetical protein